MKFLCANSDSSMSLFLYFSGMSGKLLFSAFIALRQIVSDCSTTSCYSNRTLTAKFTVIDTKVTIKFTIQNNSSVSIQSINHAYSCADGSVYKVNHGGGIAPGQKHEASILISSSKLPMTFINVSDSYPSGLSGSSYPSTVSSTTTEVLVTAN